MRLMMSIKPKNFGVIIRNVSESKKVAELDKDLQGLMDRWNAMCKRLHKAHHPSKVLSELNRGESMIRDIFNDKLSAIHVDDEALYLGIKNNIKHIGTHKEHQIKPK